MRRPVLLLTGLAAVAAVGVAFWPRRPDPASRPDGPRRLWVFEAPRPGSVVARPAVTPRAVYLAAAHARGFHQDGAVYALDPAVGKPVWVFDRDGEMLPTASSPLAVGGRLFLGEGMHGHAACRLHCLDAATGRLRWEFRTGDHVEGGPTEDGGTVFFPAGNDGLYALAAETGRFRWNFRADLHIDSTPAVAGGRVFVGSGRSRRFDAHQVVCLDARSGQPVWRTGVGLPAWGSPLVSGGRVFVGLGNGRLTASARPPETPAGAVACLDAPGGELRWTYPTGDAVFGRPVACGDRLVFGSRDGNLYGVAADDGRELFRVPMGGPVVAGAEAAGGRVYAVSVPGRVVCLDPVTGREEWRLELGRVGAEALAFAAPVVAGDRLYVAAEMRTGGAGIVTLFCFGLRNP